MDFLKNFSECKHYLNTVGVLQFLTSYGLIQKYKLCPSCGSKQTIQSNGCNDEPSYRCNNRSCRKKDSLRTGTIFARTKCSFQKFILVLTGWILKYPKNVIIRESGLSENTVQKLIAEFQQLITCWLVESSTKIGGENSFVEIDESAYGKKKDKADDKKTKWVLGGIDKNSKQCFLKFIDKRDKITLTNVILKNVKYGSTIIMDNWDRFDVETLTCYGFKKFKSNDSSNFNQTNQIMHIKNVESHWKKIKLDMRRHIGKISNTKMETYLIEYIWRSLHETAEELFLDFISAVKYFYLD